MPGMRYKIADKKSYIIIYANHICHRATPKYRVQPMGMTGMRMSRYMIDTGWFLSL
jgi:hypothetical protein